MASKRVDTDEDEVARATQLTRAASDRVLEHLRLALELSRRGRSAESVDGSDGPLGRM